MSKGCSLFYTPQSKEELDMLINTYIDSMSPPDRVAAITILGMIDNFNAQKEGSR